MRICIAETRKSCEIGLKLALLSVARHCPDLGVELFYPAADEAFVAWLPRCPRVNLNLEPLRGAYGWNIKPHALLEVLSRGHAEAMWMDADIIMNGDPRSHFSSLAADTLVVTEEALSGARDDTDGRRARAWGFAVGRVLPFTANSGVVRVTQAHVPLLRKWQSLLESDEYRAVQRLEWFKRPIHMLGDQDVLTAVLTSTDYAAVPLHFLRRGSGILQYFGPYGYTCAERLEHLLSGLPPFIHAQGDKPWMKAVDSGHRSVLRRFFKTLCIDASPYTLIARQYKAALDDEDAWMNARSATGGLLRAAGLWYPPLVGLPLACLGDMKRSID